MRQGPTAQNGIENWNALVCFVPALRGFLYHTQVSAGGHHGSYLSLL